MSLLQSLFPAMRQRQLAKRHNRMVEIADRVENTRRRYSNQTLGREAAFNAWVNDTNSRKVLKTLGRNLYSLQQEFAEHAARTDSEKVANQITDLQNLGVIYAQNAMNGVAHTSVAKRIEAVTRQASAEQKAAVKREERADARRYAQTARETVASAMDAIPSNLVTAQLDFNFSKSEKMKVGRVFNSLIDDVGRLVATYYTGGLATPYIDAARGWNQKRDAAYAGTQGAYDRIYGPGVRQIAPPSNVDLTALVGLAGGMRGGGGAAGGAGRTQTISGIHGSKTVAQRGFSWGNLGNTGRRGFSSNGWGRIATIGAQVFGGR